MIVSAAEMRGLEEKAFARGISAEALMDEGGARAATAITELLPRPGVCIAVFGKGNNGGDALVAARHLAGAGWEIHLVPAFAENAWNELVRKKFGECGLAHHHPAGAIAAAAASRVNRTGPLIVLDGLLGVGAKGALRGELLAAAKAINALRQDAWAHVFALDLPTGLNADTGEASADAVRADFTLTIGATKRGLLVDGAAGYAGRLVLVPLTELPLPPDAPEQVATPASLRPLLPRRSFDVHKGDCGRVAVVAGSRSLTGAAVMCAAACVHGGAGLVSLFVLEEVYTELAAATIPEVMVRPVTSYRAVLETKHDALAIGPGLGQSRAKEVLHVLREDPAPAVVDADGINIVAGQLDVLTGTKGPRLLTPHPGEMQRLLGGSTPHSRTETVRRFIAEHPVTLLFKGSRTIIGQARYPLSYNTTGNAGMATGGMGDILTGVCAALLAQGLSTYDAARLGAWLCGRAAEIAVLNGAESEESLSAMHILQHLGPAFRALRTGTA